MCTCIAEIKESYTEVKKVTLRVARKSYDKPVNTDNDVVFDVDKFLDAINVITKDLHCVTQATNDLVVIVRNNFWEISSQEAEDLLMLSKPIQKKMEQLYQKLMASPLYKGMQTAVGLYLVAIRDFEELCHDLKTFRIELEQNEEFQQTLRDVNEMLRK